MLTCVQLAVLCTKSINYPSNSTFNLFLKVGFEKAMEEKIIDFFQFCTFCVQIILGCVQIIFAYFTSIEFGFPLCNDVELSSESRFFLLPPFDFFGVF